MPISREEIIDEIRRVLTDEEGVDPVLIREDTVLMDLLPTDGSWGDPVDNGRQPLNSMFLWDAIGRVMAHFGRSDLSMSLPDLQTKLTVGQLADFIHNSPSD